MGFLKFTAFSLSIIFTIFLLEIVINKFPDSNSIKKWWRKNIVGEEK